MSFSRNFIRGLIENVTDEQIRALIDEHMESVTALQGKVSAAEQERDKFKAEADKVRDLEKQINDLKGDGTDWKQKYSDEQAAHQKTKDEYTAKELRASKMAVFRSEAKKAGVADKYLDVLCKASAAEIDALELDDKGEAKNSKALADGFKANWGEFIPTVQTRGANVATPPKNEPGTGVTRESIMKITDRVERRKAIAENPELFVK